MNSIRPLLTGCSTNKPAPLGEMHAFERQEVPAKRQRIPKGIDLVHDTRRLDAIRNTFSIFQPIFILEYNLQYGTGGQEHVRRSRQVWDDIWCARILCRTTCIG